MIKNKKIIYVILITLLCITLAACGNNRKRGNLKSDIVKVGDQYRDFTGTAVDGSTFHLSDHNGKVILLNFWATWCGPCVGEMPAFPKLVEKYGDNLVIVAVNSGEDQKTVDDFLNKNDYTTFHVLLDTDYAISNLYPTDGIPYTLIIDRDGTITEIQLGASGADAMYELYCKYIDAALKD